MGDTFPGNVAMALKGVKVVEMLGLAPGPLCGKILADFGAHVTVVKKINSPPLDVLSNGKRILPVNMKTEEGKKIVLKLCSTADVLIDTFRPGVMEKEGLGPEILTKENKRLIYARLSGYGQDGTFKNKAGHDINYVALSGLLSLLSKNNEPPQPPLNLLADFGGGSFLGVIGILLALFERTHSNKGQVVDISMTEGAAYLGSWVYKSRELPVWGNPPGENMLDGGVPYYCTYRTKDGKFMAVGALEPQFYSKFIEGLGLSHEEYDQYSDNKNKFQEVFLTKNQDDWVKIFDSLDACVTPVLELNNVADHPLHKSREAFVKINNNVVPSVAPRLSRTPGYSTELISKESTVIDTINILKELGYTKKEIDSLNEKGHVFYDIKSKI